MHSSKDDQTQTKISFRFCGTLLKLNIWPIYISYYALKNQQEHFSREEKLSVTNFIFYYQVGGLIRTSYNFSFFFGFGERWCKWNWIIYGLQTVRKFRTKSIVKTTRYPIEPDRTCVPTLGEDFDKCACCRQTSL